jgi:MerR family mercuric resistance operon transcriptional regulator
MAQWKQKRNAVKIARAKAAAPALTHRVTAAADVDVAAPAVRRRTDRLTISRAAALAGVGIETIRFYERKGLIEQPPRPLEGQRIYPLSTVREIRFLQHCQDLGFTLREAREMIGLTDCGAACARLSDKIHQLDEKITALRNLRDELQSLLEKRRSGVCGVMENLKDYAVLHC